MSDGWLSMFSMVLVCFLVLATISHEKVKISISWRPDVMSVGTKKINRLMLLISRFVPSLNRWIPQFSRLIFWISRFVPFMNRLILWISRKSMILKHISSRMNRRLGEWRSVDLKGSQTRDPVAGLYSLISGLGGPAHPRPRESSTRSAKAQPDARKLNQAEKHKIRKRESTTKKTNK